MAHKALDRYDVAARLKKSGGINQLRAYSLPTASRILAVEVLKYRAVVLMSL